MSKNIKWIVGIGGVLGILTALASLGLTMPWDAVGRVEAKTIAREEVEQLRGPLHRIDKRLERMENCLFLKQCGVQ